jgi:hypothetical protein
LCELSWAAGSSGSALPPASHEHEATSSKQKQKGSAADALRAALAGDGWAAMVLPPSWISPQNKQKRSKAPKLLVSSLIPDINRKKGTAFGLQ